MFRNKQDRMHGIVFFISVLGSYLILSLQLRRAGGLLEIGISLFIAGLFHVSRTRLPREVKKTKNGRKKKK